MDHLQVIHLLVIAWEYSIKLRAALLGEVLVPERLDPVYSGAGNGDGHGKYINNGDHAGKHHHAAKWVAGEWRLA